MTLEPVSTDSGNNTGELPRVSFDDTGGPPRPRRIRPVHFTLKLGAFVAVLYFGMATIIPGVRKSWGELRNVSPWLLLLGLGLELAALYSYSMLTRAALGEAGHIVSSFRLFRIQVSTKALSSVVPGGSAAGSALGYRLMTLSGIPGPDAGFALATAGLGSAVVLNLIFWAGLLVSIPIRGVNPGYATAAVAGIVLMVIAGALVVGLLEGQRTAERIIRWIARRAKLSEERASAGVRQVAGRLEDLVADRGLLARVAGWAAANWLLDIAALWVFLRAYGESTDVDALIVAFGLVNVLAVIPITPGGLGIIDGGLPLALTGFGLTKATAVLGTATYRLAQYFFPIVLGGILYGTLRVGPWSIKRRAELKRLRELAGEAVENRESVLDFAARFGRRRPGQAAGAVDGTPTPPVADPDPGDPGTADPHSGAGI